MPPEDAARPVRPNPMHQVEVRETFATGLGDSLSPRITPLVAIQHRAMDVLPGMDTLHDIVAARAGAAPVGQRTPHRDGTASVRIDDPFGKAVEIPRSVE